MIKGLYTSAMGMLAHEKELNVTSNNLANVATTGYKRDRITFEEFPRQLELRLNDTKLAPGQKRYVPPAIGKLGTGTILDRVTTDHQAGTLRETHNPTDLALDNKAYFMVQTPKGMRFTKDGQFRITEEGNLVTRQGYRVLGTGGEPAHMTPIMDEDGLRADGVAPVVIPNPRDFQIAEDGQITSGGAPTGQNILKVAFRDTRGMQKEGSNFYNLESGTALFDGNHVLKQGYLETSNVNVVQEMVNMIKVNRAYEANSKILSGIDERIGQAAREVGQIQG